MNEREFSKMLAKIEFQFGEEGEHFVECVETMMDMLNDSDSDDYFGTEGFRHILGWE